MAEEVILIPNSQVTIDNQPTEGGFALNILGYYAKERIEYNRELKNETVAVLLASIVQMAAYWILFKNMLDDRDSALEDMMKFMRKLRERTKRVDLPILKLKAEALNIPEPELDICSSSKLFEEESQKDGKQLDKVNLSFGKSPDGWGVHYGWLASALASSTASSYATYTNKTRYHTFMAAKAKLLVRAQTSMKSVYNANGIMAYYQQAAKIYSGLADIFIQGFNSGGAALGTAIGRMSGMSSTGSGATSGYQVRIGMGQYDG